MTHCNHCQRPRWGHRKMCRAHTMQARKHTAAWRARQKQAKPQRPPKVVREPKGTPSASRSGVGRKDTMHCQTCLECGHTSAQCLLGPVLDRLTADVLRGVANKMRQFKWS